MADNIDQNITKNVNSNYNIDFTSTGLEKTIEDVSRLSKAFNNQVNSIKNVYGGFKSLTTTIASFTGATISLGKSLDTLIDYNKNILGLSAQWNKYGISITQVENRVEGLTKTLSLTRSEVMKLASSFEKAFPYTTLSGVEKIFINIKNVVGSNAEAMGSMQNALSSISTMFPSMQKSLENMSEIDKDRLTSSSRMLFLAGKINQEQYRTLRDYINQNEQISQKDKERMEQSKEYLKVMGDLKVFWEKIAIVVGKAIMPTMKTLTDFLVRNQSLIEKIVGFTTKWLIPLLLIKKIFGSIFQIGSGVGGMISSIVGSFGKKGGSAGASSVISSFGAQKVWVTNPGFGSTGNLAQEVSGSAKETGKLTGLLKSRMARLGIGAGLIAGGAALGEFGEQVKESGYKKTGAGIGIAGSAASIGGYAMMGSALGPVGTAGGAIIGVAKEMPKIVDNIREIAGIKKDENFLPGWARGTIKAVVSDSVYGVAEQALPGVFEDREGKAVERKGRVKRQMGFQKTFAEEELAKQDEYKQVQDAERKRYLSGTPKDFLANLESMEKRKSDIEIEKGKYRTGDKTGLVDKIDAASAMVEFQKQRKEGLIKQKERQIGLGQGTADIDEQIEAIQKNISTAAKEFSSAKSNLTKTVGKDLYEEERKISEEEEKQIQYMKEQDMITKQQLSLNSSRLSSLGSLTEKAILLGTKDQSFAEMKQQNQNYYIGLKKSEEDLDKSILVLRHKMNAADKNTEEGRMERAAAEEELNSKIKQRADLEKQEYESLLMTFNVLEQIAQTSSSLAATRSSLLESVIDQRAYLGTNENIELAITETVKDRNREIYDLNIAYEEAKSKLKDMEVDSVEFLRVQEKMLGISMKMNAARKDAVEAQLKITDQHKIDLKLAEQNSQLAEMNVQLLDSFVTGLGASAEMRMKSIEMSENQLDITRKQISELNSMDEIEKNKPIWQEKMNEFKLKELSITMKIAEQSKALRDGWVDSIKAMQIGSGRISKIVVDQNKNLGVGMKYLDGFVRTYKSGAVGRAGEGMVGSAGSERFQANMYGAGGVDILGGRSASPYATDYGPSISQTNAIVQGLRGRNSSAAVGTIQGMSARATAAQRAKGGYSLAGGTTAASIMMAQGVGTGAGGGSVTDRGISSSGSVTVPINMVFEINNNGDIKNIASKVSDMVEKRLSEQYGKNVSH